jgi:hypothetical protein
MSVNGDFYEEDEPVAGVRAAFERGEKGRTRRPVQGQTEQLWPDVDVRLLAPVRGWTVYVDVPGDASLLAPESDASTRTVAY